MTYFALFPANIGTEIDEGQGLLVKVDGKIIAVLTRLRSEIHGEARGSWFIEAGFGLCAEPQQEPFRRLSECLNWLAIKMGRHPNDLRREVESYDETYSLADWPREG